MKKNTLSIFIVMTVLGLLLSACQPAQTATDAGAPSDPDVPAEEATQAPAEVAPTATLDPILSTDVRFDPASGADPTGLVYEVLLKEENGELFPTLALAATVSDDGLDYIISLRPGVTFHNGSVLNADTVIANFNRWYDPNDTARGNGTYEAWATNFGGFKGETDEDGIPKSQYDGIEKVDELTVLVHLNKPDAEFLNKLANSAFAIVSQNNLTRPLFGSEALGDGGTGRYTIGSWSETGLSLDPYADYWNPAVVPDSSMDITFSN
ncbi:MAG: ABC transporter substrate-binding protein [Anaerolineae bacterium]|nr:ABC transporter substrate-binding protein [Anaerolineae bacterium]MDK1080336.1 ABC transporter substrate-binding protein [Anaerolineae bacterium]